MAKLEYCVIGLSRFGNQVADQLKNYGKSVMVLDINQDLINIAAKKYDIAAKCDCTDLKNLIDLGIQNAKIVIVACDNLEKEIMICANLKHLEVPLIIAQAKTAIHERVLKTLGVSLVVVPEIDAANKIAIQCVYNLGADVTLIGTNASLVRTIVFNDKLNDKSILELDLRKKYGAIIIYVQRKDTTIFPIVKTTIIKTGDLVLLICLNKELKKVLKLFAKTD